MRGFEDEVEQSLPRPCRQTNGGSKRTCELTSSIVPRGTSFYRSWGSKFPSILWDKPKLSILALTSFLPIRRRVTWSRICHYR